MNPVPAMATRRRRDMWTNVVRLSPSVKQKLSRNGLWLASITRVTRGTSVDSDREVWLTSLMLTAGESQDPTSPTGAGRVLSLIRDGEAVTRADLARRTGLARSTVAQRVEALMAHRFVYEAGGTASTGGRPPTVLAFNRAAGVVLVAALGATHARIAVTDLAGDPLIEHGYETDIARLPEQILYWVNERFDDLLGEIDRTREEVRGIGVGIPAPVAFSRGEAVAPPMMPGWDGFSIPAWFARHYDAPLL